MAEETSNVTLEDIRQEQAENSTFSFQAIYKALILNWYWFILSLIIFLGGAYIYLRYSTPTYQVQTKLLVKDDDSKNGGMSSSLANASASTLGLISNSNGIDNEIEILQSHTLAAQVARDLKLYVSYQRKGRVKNMILYKDQPVSVDIDPGHLEKLNQPIQLTVKRSGNSYEVEGTYCVPIDEQDFEGPFSITKKFASLPAQISTRAGLITLSQNGTNNMKDGDIELVSIVSPQMASNQLVSGLSVSQTSKTTTIAQLTVVDPVPRRAIDFLNQLAVDYNRQANDDKNQIALRTEKFINSRLEKINSELGQTEGQLQDFKERNKMIELKANATSALSNQDESFKQLREMDTQVELLHSIRSFMNQRGNRFQVIPSNVGLSDQSSTALINKYNELVLERNRLLRSAAPNSPVVEPITDQINDMYYNIRQAIDQALQALEIQRGALESMNQKYDTQVAETPQQERILTQIGRQQEVKSGLYLMLLQKREENSISLAATADKGKLIDMPELTGKVAPKTAVIGLMGLLLGFGVPALIIFLVSFFRYKIEGHFDVAKLTKLPIIADVAVASNAAKTKADIVVHANENNLMEEIFRSIRTNLQFMLKEKQKVIMFTSTTSGEGKTFTCANTAVSFALLGKKVLMVGLDVRKPRIADLFQINDFKHGITPLLIKDNPTMEDIQSQILPSGINNNLDLLPAGPIPPNPAELVSRNSLNTIFAHLREVYDYILVDTAPVGLVTDTLQIARIADATCFMCRADYTPKSSFELINSLAEENKLPNMSIIINGIDMSKRKYGYDYGYGRYGKYARYGSHSQYGKQGTYGHYGSYGSYGYYGGYGNYTNSHYGKKDDNSLKR